MKSFLFGTFIFLNATIYTICLQSYFIVSRTIEEWRGNNVEYAECISGYFTYPFVQISEPIYYVHDAWVKDSVRLNKEIFETKIVIHSCDNVINTLSDDVPNKEYYIESLQYKKHIYINKLDSLNIEHDNLMNRPDRYDTSIDYVKTYILKI